MMYKKSLGLIITLFIKAQALFLDKIYTDWYTIYKEAHMDNRENILKSAFAFVLCQGL